jgi:hypothetical protein
MIAPLRVPYWDGGLLIPSGQEFTSWTETLKTFNEVTIPALFGFIIFVFLLLGFYFLRGVFGRDKRSNVTTDKILELMGMMQQGAKDRQQQIDRFALQMEKSDDLSRAALAGVQAAMTSLAQSNDNQTTSIRALIGRTDHSVTLLQNVTSSINQTTLDLGALKASVAEMTATANRVYDKLAMLFPREEAVESVVEEILTEALKDVCKEKRATDEHKVTVTIVPPPDAPESAA